MNKKKVAVQSQLETICGDTAWGQFFRSIARVSCKRTVMLDGLVLRWHFDYCAPREIDITGLNEDFYPDCDDTDELAFPDLNRVVLESILSVGENMTFGDDYESFYVLVLDKDTEEEKYRSEVYHDPLNAFQEVIKRLNEELDKPDVYEMPVIEQGSEQCVRVLHWNRHGSKIQLPQKMRGKGLFLHLDNGKETKDVPVLEVFYVKSVKDAVEFHCMTEDAIGLKKELDGFFRGYVHALVVPIRKPSEATTIGENYVKPECVISLQQATDFFSAMGVVTAVLKDTNLEMQAMEMMTRILQIQVGTDHDRFLIMLEYADVLVEMADGRRYPYPKDLTVPRDLMKCEMEVTANSESEGIVWQMSLFIADKEQFLVLCDDFMDEGERRVVWSPPAIMHRIDEGVDTTDEMKHNLISYVEKKSGLIITADQIQYLPIKATFSAADYEETMVKAIMGQTDMKLKSHWYFVDAGELLNRSIKGSGATWVRFDQGRDIVWGLLCPYSLDLFGVVEWYGKTHGILGWE